MKFKLGVEMGIVGCHREGIIDVPDEELDGMNWEEVR